MKNAALILAVALVVASSATASATALYRCTLEQGLSLNNDGRFEANKATEFWRGGYSPLIVDTASGTVRFGSAAPVSWTIFQRGDGEASNDWIIAPPVGDVRLTKVAITDFIRIRAWKESPRPIIFMIRLTMMFSGTCAEVK
jgi:hypothetical protein